MAQVIYIIWLPGAEIKLLQAKILYLTVYVDGNDGDVDGNGDGDGDGDVKVKVQQSRYRLGVAHMIPVS